MQLKDQVIIITGASRGIGRAMALRFGLEGATVVCTGRTESDLAGTVSQIRASGGSGIWVKTDVYDEESVKALVQRVIDEFGAIDTLVNNAATSEQMVSGDPKPLAELTKKEWDYIIGVNLTGPFLCCRYTLPHMIKRKRGNIINVSSGKSREPLWGWGAYVCSKHGLEGLTKELALELKDYGINVNSLIPGGAITQTGFHARRTDEEWEELRRQGKVSAPEVINEAAVFLASQQPFGISGKSFEARAFQRQNFATREAARKWLESIY